jgi:hypothetical protein
VSVGGPGVGQIGSVEQRPQRRRGSTPEAEGTVDVQPGLVLVGDGGDLTQRVDGAAVHVAGLGADDGRAVHMGQQLAELVGPHPPLPVSVDTLQCPRAEAEVAHGR